MRGCTKFHSIPLILSIALKPATERIGPALVQDGSIPYQPVIFPFNM